MTRLISFLLFIFFFTASLAQGSASAQDSKLLILGDSLSAGYNMDIKQSWPSLLPDALAKHDKAVTVVNGSISGDTTGNGLARLPQLLEEHAPDTVLIELGANDGLRGFPPKLMSSNLDQIIEQIKAAGAKPIMMQIKIPPNYGKRYNQQFEYVFAALADQQNVPLLPFFLEHIILKPEWMMNDGLHPKPEAQPWIAEFVAEELYQYL
ncbi:multifunctional acyl-CoA thioesterase I and protease I and lysophospholipase L1 [Vibrio chagasii]|uniref:arylesterase n=1 Tax=Vibrio TaxID=662 RepID=UPI00076A98F9|nr:arylesterase [Vibrio splendidus]CAH6796460.1 multifunctional acyl-CoA thioesterase I and protease I and lysophospholipase L1 [Vibrio chagasii]CAH6923445.1 multifunctional acyl-CoA thioesterase I and protease I and lysophospholipase L1 [Vibrio chagasii]CAH6946940.1 multifunctional acyl-CoA thioesterase I and protease I and lysophospholipase L1 [Vibrio chagasii]CAH6947110.1 multifunctional acyl-CoA thioesterase I and protease I and lysophospholipase L1 [Vibrio chagasii]CAH7005627.1 multifunct